MGTKAKKRESEWSQMARTRGLALCLLLLSACFGSPRPDDVRTTTRPTDSPDATVATELPPLTLIADLDEPPVRWREVAFLLSGDRVDEIGIDRCYHCERVFPTALSVAPDGSFWIADTYKRRIAHFAPDGSFIEAIATNSRPADLVFVGGRLYVLLTERGRTVAAVGESGELEPIVVNADGKPLHVYALVENQDRLLAVIAGAQRLLGRYWALAFVDSVTGEVTPAPGVHVYGDVSMDLVPLQDSRPLSFEVRWLQATADTSRREIRFQLVRGSKPRRTTVGDAYIRTGTPTGIATIVGLGSGRGTWYLEIPVDGGKPVFERIPDQGFLDDMRRTLSVGPDREIYWMRWTPEGLHIHRR
jgi:hypothetical protein